MTRVELATGLRVLAELAGSGLPVSRIVSVFPSLAIPAWIDPANTIRRSVGAGSPLSAAIATAVPDIPAYLVATVRAGERGMGIGDALHRAATEAEAEARRRQELVQALSYPSILLATGVACVLLVVTVVLPRFATIMAEMDQSLPRGATVLLAARDSAPWIAVVLVAGSAVVIWSYHSVREHPETARRFDASLLAMPIAGEAIRARSSERIFGVLASLLEARVALPAALRLVSDVTPNTFLAGALLGARESVIRGASLSDALVESQVISVQYAQLVRVGEETGRLAPAIRQVAAFARDAGQSQLRRLLQLFEPTMLLVIAGFVGLVALILMQTIYSVRPGT